MVGLTYSLAGFEGSLCLSDQVGSLQLYYFVMGTMSISGAHNTHIVTKSDNCHIKILNRIKDSLISLLLGHTKSEIDILKTLLMDRYIYKHR